MTVGGGDEQVTILTGSARNGAVFGSSSARKIAERVDWLIPARPTARAPDRGRDDARQQASS